MLIEPIRARARRVALVTTCSLSALVVAGCIGHHDASRVTGDMRHGSIKDTPGSLSTAKPKVRLQRKPQQVSLSTRVSEPPATRLTDPATKPVVKAEVPDPSVKVAIQPAPSAALAANPPAHPSAAAPLPKVVSPPAIAVKTTEPPRATIETVPPLRATIALPPVVAAAVPQAPASTAAPLPPPAAPAPPKVAEPVMAKAADTVAAVAAPSTIRPTAEIRQAPAPATKTEAKPETVLAVAPPPAQPAMPATAPPVPAVAAKVAPVQAPVRQTAIAGSVAPPQAAVPTDDERVNKVLTLAVVYLRSGRVENARSLLEDHAKSGNPTVLTALAESYDPLKLRETFPKLSRVGVGAKALEAYERAKAAGAPGLEPRIDALRAFLGTRP